METSVTGKHVHVKIQQNKTNCLEQLKKSIFVFFFFFKLSISLTAKLPLQDFRSRKKHVTKVSVCAIKPNHQRQGQQHKRPGDPLGTCRQRTWFGGRWHTIFTRL